jgi:hypothetical protein
MDLCSGTVTRNRVAVAGQGVQESKHGASLSSQNALHDDCKHLNTFRWDVRPKITLAIIDAMNTDAILLLVRDFTLRHIDPDEFHNLVILSGAARRECGILTVFLKPILPV